MKATLEFDLDDPVDNISHLRCVKSINMAIVLFEIIHNFKLCEKDNKKLLDLLEEYKLNIDELIE